MTITEAIYVLEMVEAHGMAIEAKDMATRSLEAWKTVREKLKDELTGLDMFLDKESAIKWCLSVIDKELETVDKTTIKKEEDYRECWTCEYSKNGKCGTTETCHQCMWECQYVQTRGWIPVEERNPEEPGQYLVTLSDHSTVEIGTYRKYLERDGLKCKISDGWFGYDHNGKSIYSLDVIAWALFPESYTGGENG